MTSELNDDGLGERGLSANSFAERYGFSAEKVKEMCSTGHIQGARRHPLTRQWWLYPPLKVLFSPGGSGA